MNPEDLEQTASELGALAGQALAHVAGFHDPTPLQMAGAALGNLVGRVIAVKSIAKAPPADDLEGDVVFHQVVE